mgnify:CR=1 FL=1
MAFRTLGPSGRTDSAYIQQMALAIAELQTYQKATLTQISASYPANTPNEVILVTAAAPITVSLPLAKGFYGQTLFVKKMDASGNAVTIAAKAGETIDGTPTKAIATRFMSYTLMSFGTGWVIV